MARLQFRVWDEVKKKMLYDNFIVRHGNPAPQEWYDKYNDFQRRHDFEEIPRPEYEHCHAEPEESPMSQEANDAISDIMEPDCIGGATWALIDYSNFYFENYVTMQCTGFHDKNNKLIWEGDLLKFGDLVYPVSWYYSSYTWNGQMIADFREFDNYGNQIVDNHCRDSIAFAIGYQGDVYGIQTENMEKVGNIFEHGEQYGFSKETIKMFTPSLPV